MLPTTTPTSTATVFETTFVISNDTTRKDTYPVQAPGKGCRERDSSFVIFFTLVLYRRRLLILASLHVIVLKSLTCAPTRFLCPPQQGR